MLVTKMQIAKLVIDCSTALLYKHHFLNILWPWSS